MTPRRRGPPTRCYLRAVSDIQTLKDAWTQALPGVLALMGEPQRNLYRRELQQFLALSRFDKAAAAEHFGPLRELLMQSARAAKQPAAISATRASALDVPALVTLCEHILAQWLPALEGTRPPAACGIDGAAGDVVFGPRLGGPGRPGALTRDD